MSDDLQRRTEEAVASLRSAIASGRGVRDALRAGFSCNATYFTTVWIECLVHALGLHPSSSDIAAFVARLEASRSAPADRELAEAMIRGAFGDVGSLRSLSGRGLSGREFVVTVADALFAVWRPTPAELDEVFRHAGENERIAQVLLPPGLLAEPGDPAPKLTGVRLGKEDAEAFILRAQTYANAGLREDALTDYDTAIILDPDNVTALTQRGMLRDLLGRQDEALADFDRAIGLDPGNQDGYAGRGNIHAAQERHELAVADYDRALELAPDNPYTLNQRVTTLRVLERYPEALADACRAIEIDHSVHSYSGRAEVYYGMGRYEDALADYNRALAADPSEHWHLAGRAQVYQAMGRHRTALADLNQAIELNPGEPWMLLIRGELLEEMSRPADARADFARAIELEPSYAEEYGDRT